MPAAKLDWSTATVKEAKLTVALEGELPRGWRESFETTAWLLGHGRWGKISVKKREVRVSEVSPGTEEDVRHYLESVVLQANANTAPDEDSTGPEESEADEDSKAEAARGPDTEMTEQFRAFAEPDGD